MSLVRRGDVIKNERHNQLVRGVDDNDVTGEFSDGGLVVFLHEGGFVANGTGVDQGANIEVN